MAWFPQGGPQLAFIEADWADEVFYGGERGGGKSDAQLGYQEDGALKFRENWRGIMFRKTYPELEELQSRAMEIFQASGAVFKSQQSAGYPFSNTWYWPSGASVKMRYIENEKDYGRYHGHQYCVEVNTRVWMADGSLIPIKDLRPGDYVATLEGPRRVLATIAPYRAPCVRITTHTGEQVHPIWHPVLASVGDISELRRDEFQSDAQPLPWLAAQSVSETDRSNQDFDASLASGRSDCAAFAGEPLAASQLLRSCVSVMLVSQLVRSACFRVSKQPPSPHKSNVSFLEKYQSESPLWRKDQQPRRSLWQLGLDRAVVVSASPHASCGLLEMALTQDCKAGYQRDFRSYDELFRALSGTGQDGAPSPSDVEAPSRAASRADGMGCIPEYSRRALYRYTHPYTKEQRQGALALESDNASIEFCGDALVCDLTIEGVNHYVTEIGLVNKNTGISFDEVTEYATPSGLLRMLSTLRSAAGVPCTVRLTGNPGGIGHSWVKSRYIDVGPSRAPYLDPETGFTRMFIPSKLSDNQILLEADPAYRNRIMAATYGNDALRKAWLEGDWNIVAGAFFNCWSQQMILTPCALPADWTRFRSGDWGSARPFSFGWWVIATDDFNHPDGQTIPKGSLIRYREYYGCADPIKSPNTGLKLPAEDVARRIIHLERGETISYGVLDPAAFSSDGGPSIAERLYAGSERKLLFRRADNARVASKGAMGGWDQMRARMLGEDGTPRLYCFSNCTDSIRTIPMLQHDENRVEDVNSDMEDHAGDEWRYACMSRPYVRAIPAAEQKPRFLAELTADEIFFPKGKQRSGERRI